jgi:hypothetical protein
MKALAKPEIFMHEVKRKWRRETDVDPRHTRRGEKRDQESKDKGRSRQQRGREREREREQRDQERHVVKERERDREISSDRSLLLTSLPLSLSLSLSFALSLPLFQLLSIPRIRETLSALIFTLESDARLIDAKMNMDVVMTNDDVINIAYPFSFF